MSAHEVDRGGRPRQFDEDQLIDRIEGFDDLVLIEAALLENGVTPRAAQGCVDWLWRKRAGDRTGGRNRVSASRYRRMLADLLIDPLKPPGGRRRTLREAARQRGSADLILVAGLAAAGAVALAIAGHSPSEALRALHHFVAPIMPEASEDDAAAEIRADPVLVGPWAADGARECVLGARRRPPRARVECTSRFGGSSAAESAGSWPRRRGFESRPSSTLEAAAA